MRRWWSGQSNINAIIYFSIPISRHSMHRSYIDLNCHLIQTMCMCIFGFALVHVSEHNSF